MNNNNITSQMALNFTYRPSLGRDDFMVASSNLAATTAIDLWPNWLYFAICIYGSSGCGKTHLANVFAQNVASLTHHPYRIPFIQASSLTLEQAHDMFSLSPYIVIEDLQNLHNQEALFHLYNTYRDLGGNILFTCNQAPARLNFSLPDLRSRLNIVPIYEISAPDDQLLMALLLKLFNDRQITPSSELLNYILKNMQRSFSYARKLVEEIDNISLSRKRAVSIVIAKEAMSVLNSDRQFSLL
ncbi:MAG: DNA replication protein [Alphaproteobacteria bacterium]|nr:DNA replication protein [Alphaproteobacteria bacterium]MBQ9235846.1 DNA replication protein [Alphaproteobacteria bacterium]